MLIRKSGNLFFGAKISIATRTQTQGDGAAYDRLNVRRSSFLVMTAMTAMASIASKIGACRREAWKRRRR